MKWKDAKGREWTIVVDYGGIVAVKRATGLDLSQAIVEKSTVIEELIGDPVMFFETLVALLDEQMKEAGVSLEDFGKGISDEEVVSAASRALVEAIIDFFPENRREPLKKAFRRLWTLSKEKHDLEAEKAISFIDGPEFEAAAKQAVETGEFNTGTTSSDGVSD